MLAFSTFGQKHKSEYMIKLHNSGFYRIIIFQTWGLNESGAQKLNSQSVHGRLMSGIAGRMPDQYISIIAEWHPCSPYSFKFADEHLSVIIFLITINKIFQ